MLKVNPASKVGLLEWLKTKDPNEEYDYWDCDNCALAQYAKHHTGSSSYSDFFGSGPVFYASLTHKLNVLAMNHKTFGELRKAVEASL